jgi:hypothetical protein
VGERLEFEFNMYTFKRIYRVLQLGRILVDGKRITNCSEKGWGRLKESTLCRAVQISIFIKIGKNFIVNKWFLDFRRIELIIVGILSIRWDSWKMWFMMLYERHDTTRRVSTIELMGRCYWSGIHIWTCLRIYEYPSRFLTYFRLCNI